MNDVLKPINGVNILSFGLSAFNSTWFVSIILIIYMVYYICYKIFGRGSLWSNIFKIFYLIHVAVLKFLPSDINIPYVSILGIGIVATLAGVIVYNYGERCMKLCLKRTLL